MNWDTVIAALISGCAGVLVGLLPWTSRRRVDQADASQRLNDAALALIQPYQAEVEKLREKVACLESKMDGLMNENAFLSEIWAGAHLLVHQVRSLGGTPIYTPPERRIEAGPESPTIDPPTKPARRKGKTP